MAKPLFVAMLDFWTHFGTHIRVPVVVQSRNYLIQRLPVWGFHPDPKMAFTHDQMKTALHFEILPRDIIVKKKRKKDDVE